MSALLLLLPAAVDGLADPTPPAVEYLYTVNLTFPKTNLTVGATPLGKRGGWPIDGGVFAGPKMNG